MIRAAGRETVKAMRARACLLPLCAVAACVGLTAFGERLIVPLSGPGWTCDGAEVTVPHTWNAVDGADGFGPENGDSVSARSYVRKEVRYVRALPDPHPGKRCFIRCEAVCQKARVLVNGREAGRHVGAFTAFCFDITSLLKPSGNVLEIFADNRIDVEVPPIQADFTMFGGIYRDVWMFETDMLHIDPTEDGAPGVEIDPDPATGEVVVRVAVKGGVPAKTIYTVTGPGLAAPVVSESPRFRVPGFRLWSPEEPNVYRLTASVSGEGGNDAVTLPFGFRRIAFGADGFRLNGKLRQMRGVNYHQDRKGKGWAVSQADIAADLRLIRRELGADAIRTAHYPHSDFCYDRCDEEGLLAWVEAPNVNRIRFTPAYTENARTLVREMVRQLRHHPSIFTWSTSNEINFKGQDTAETVRFMKMLADVARAADPSRPDSTATFRSYQVAQNAVPTIIGFNFYPGWYRSTPDGMHETINGVLAENPALKTMAVTEYGAAASVFQHAETLTRGGASNRATCPMWHPEEYQSWVHYRNYRALVADSRIWGAFVWLMFDFAADVVNEGDPFGLNDKGLMTYDHTGKKDAFWFYRANWRPDVLTFHLVGKRLTSLTNATATVLGFSTVGPVTLRLNGVTVGTQAPDEVKAVCWRDLPLRIGANKVELEAAGRIETATWTRIASPDPSRAPDDRPWLSDEERMGVGMIEPELGEPMTFVDGRIAQDAASRAARRRETLELFERFKYGFMPPKPQTNACARIGERTIVSCGMREVLFRQHFRTDLSGPAVDWAVYLPTQLRGRAPVVLMLNDCGNAAFAEREAELLSTLARRGYALVTADYRQMTADPRTPEEWRAKVCNGLYELWGPRNPKTTDNPGALIVWAWGLSRGLDLAAGIPEIDAARSIVTGRSRPGQAAFVAGAFDERFAVTAPGEIDGTDVRLLRRSFPHGFCGAFWRLADFPEGAHLDPRALMACIAPRGFLLGSGSAFGWDAILDFADRTFAGFAGVTQ